MTRNRYEVQLRAAGRERLLQLLYQICSETRWCCSAGWYGNRWVNADAPPCGSPRCSECADYAAGICQAFNCGTCNLDQCRFGLAHRCAADPCPFPPSAHSSHRASSPIVQLCRCRVCGSEQHGARLFVLNGIMPQYRPRLFPDGTRNRRADCTLSTDSLACPVLLEAELSRPCWRCTPAQRRAERVHCGLPPSPHRSNSQCV